MCMSEAKIREEILTALGRLLFERGLTRRRPQGNVGVGYLER